MTSIIDENTVTVAEAAELLHVSLSTISRWIKQGDLPAYHVGKRHVRIRRDDLEQMVHSTSVEAKTETDADQDEARRYALYGPTPEQIAEARSKHRKLTDEERRRGLEAIERLREMRQEQLRRRGGVPFPPSWKIINKMRDERTRQLEDRNERPGSSSMPVSR